VTTSSSQSTPSRIARALAGIPLALALLSSIVHPAVAQLHQRTVSEPGPADEAKSRRQRQSVDDMVRRHLGTRLRGDTRDLDALQRLLDDDYIRANDVLGQQALGVVLADVMVAQLGLDWIVVDDDYGHSRGLRWRKSDQLFFPITMISKRIQAGERVRVRALYTIVEDRVKVLRARP
jgi:hypothetical protein